MATDTLARERQVDNIIDRLERLEERVARLEERLRETAEAPVRVQDINSGIWWLLQVVDLGGDVGPMLLMVEV